MKNTLTSLRATARIAPTIFVLLLLFSACERNTKDPGYEVKMLTDMVYPVPYEAFQESPTFPNGQTLQSPVVGTIPRGAVPFHYGKSDEDAILAGQELQNPVPLTSESLARGKDMYTIFCDVCHGPQGQGDGVLIPKFPNPPAFTSKRVKEFSDGRIYYVITRGGKIMPPHNTQIAPEDRWKIVQYVRSLQQGAKK